MGGKEEEEEAEKGQTREGEAWMASSLPTRERHVMERAKVFRAFPLRVNSISFSDFFSRSRWKSRALPFGKGGNWEVPEWNTWPLEFDQDSLLNLRRPRHQLSHHIGLVQPKS